MGQGWHWMEQHCHSQRWVRLGAASGCNIPEHCLLGRNHLLAASVPTRASHSTQVPSRDCAEWAMTEQAVTVPMGANSSRYKTWNPHKKFLLHIPPVSKRSQAIQVRKLSSPGAVTPCRCTVLLRVLKTRQ